MELSSEEKKVLSGITFHSEEVEKGELCDEDKELLSELRAVKAYLTDKYKDYNFEVTGCEPKAGTARDYNEWYYKAEGVDRASAFIAMVWDKDGAFDIRDDFYGETIKEGASDAVKKLLGYGGFPVAEVNVSFWEYFGKELGQDLDPALVLRGDVHAGNDIKIFLDGSRLPSGSYENEIGKLETSLKEAGIKGDVYVVVLKNAEGDPVMDRLYSDSFELS
ncbi:hypothetical protein [Butyrivibrio sp. VCB2006]|uniref:hypothetical protein n=1 Tax=Butyrivibrio sp. VCB2006 TaxID=1280679 RepID=UPI00042477DC|nr:hypothetical protein [Butyrivibrio sp. VCB2006]